MTRDDRSSAQACLPVLIAADRSLAFSAFRFHAAICDLAPLDDEGIATLTASVRLGVPTLVTDGQVDAATNLLIAHAGLRSEIAEQLVQSWVSALLPSNTRPQPATGSSGTFVELSHAAVERALSSSGPTHCAVWPDGGLSVVVLTLDGLHVATSEVPVGKQRAHWYRVAAPTAALSREASICRAGDATMLVVWSDRTGLWGRAMRRTPTGVELAESRLLSPPGSQARYPVAALLSTGGDVDVFWSDDRTRLFATTMRSWAQPEQRDVPSPCEPGERLRTLDAAASSEASSWLICTTDRNRVFVARWDVANAEHDGWRPVPLPQHTVVGLAIVDLPAGPTAIAVSAQGRVSAIDARAAYNGTGHWHNVQVPTRLGDVVAVAADAYGDVAWATFACVDQVVLARLSRYDLQLECPAAVQLDSWTAKP